MSLTTDVQTEALERVLADLLAEYEQLLELAELHRKALREADAQMIARISSARVGLNARIEALNTERAELVASIAGGIEPGGTTIRSVLSELGKPASDRISALADRLREVIERARHEHRAIGEATTTFAGHLSGILNHVIQNYRVGQVYTSNGQVASGPAMPAAMDLRH
ncbi:MAG TPA: flagellar protein FlgN [Phycisphaerales bacterium]|nr:flagellar protein FlgN [Phycisphaerales bacterium]